MNDPKLDDMIKNVQAKDNIFTIKIEYNLDNNHCKLSYPVGPNNLMFWGAIWAAMSEARIIFEEIRMTEIRKFKENQPKQSGLLLPKM